MIRKSQNMQTITTVGLDIAKSVFQVHGIEAEGKVIIRRQLKRRYVLAFFEKLPRGSIKWQDDRSDMAGVPHEWGYGEGGGNFVSAF